jgi:hypothetical protein
MAGSTNERAAWPTTVAGPDGSPYYYPAPAAMMAMPVPMPHYAGEYMLPPEYYMPMHPFPAYYPVPHMMGMGMGPPMVCVCACACATRRTDGWPVLLFRHEIVDDYQNPESQSLHICAVHYRMDRPPPCLVEWSGVHHPSVVRDMQYPPYPGHPGMFAPPPGMEYLPHAHALADGDADGPEPPAEAATEGPAPAPLPAVPLEQGQAATSKRSCSQATCIGRAVQIVPTEQGACKRN